MVALLIAWATSTLALWVTASVLPGFTITKGAKGAALVALILGLLSFLLQKLLFVVIGIGTLGLGFVFERITQWLVATILLVITDKVSKTLTINSFGIAAVAALVIIVLQTLANAVIRGLM